MPSALDNMKRQVEATIDAYNAWDYDALRATRSKDFIYRTLPSTLNTPPRNNDEYAEHFHNHLTPLFKKFKATPLSTIHDVEARRSVIFARVDVETIAGAESVEIVGMMSFDETGQKITGFDEFFDSLAMTQAFARVHAAKAEKGE